MHWFTVLLLVTMQLIFLFLLYYMRAKCKQTYWSRRGIYSPPTHWYYGHAYEVVTRKCSISEHLANICKDPSNQRAPVIGVYYFHKPYLLLRDPDLIRRVLFKDFRFFVDRRFFMTHQNDVIDNANLYAIKYPHWKCLRSRLELAFVEDRRRGLLRLFLAGTKNLRRYLDKKVPPNEQVDVQMHEVARRFITDVMISLNFGVNTNSFAKPDNEIYKHSCGLYKTTQGRATYMNFLFPRLINFGFDTSLTQHVDFFRNLFWKSMKERKITGVGRGDFIDILLELTNSDQDKKFKFEGDWLFAQALILTVAGLETSALTMSLTLLEMARNPQIQKRARQEIRDKIGFKAISLKLLAKMNYLESVISETLRMYPPTQFLNRVAREDYKIANSNIVIEKGTVVYISLKGLHQNPQYYSSPTKYNPDRFSKKNSKISPYTYLPFGDGPRMCIGNRIAFMQIMVGLIIVLKNYSISTNLNVPNKGRTSTALDDFHVCFKRFPALND